MVPGKRGKMELEGRVGVGGTWEIKSMEGDSDGM